MSDSMVRRGPGLVWTLLGALILVAILPLIVSNYFLVGINKEALSTLEKKYLTRSAVAIASDIDNLVRSYTNQLESIAGGLSTVAVLSTNQDVFASIGDTGLIETYVKNDPDILALRLIDRRGVGAQVVPGDLGPEVAAELDAILTQTLTSGKDEPTVGRFIYLPSRNTGAIVIALPIRDPFAESGGAVIGAAEALVSLRAIKERVATEKQQSVEAFVVDKTGKVLLHSEPAISVQQPNYSKLVIVSEFINAQVPVRLTQSYEDTVKGNRRQVLGTVAPVTAMPWAVVVQEEHERAFASVDAMMRATWGLGAVALLLAIVVGVIFATGLSRPIRALAEITHEIAKGNYQQRVEVRSRNEIGTLADNFNVMSKEIQKKVEELKKAAAENHSLFINSIRMLAAAIDAKDPYTRGHSERVARYSIGIGKHMGLSKEEMTNLRISALLHDVGKIGIDDRILRKPGALSDEEFEVMKTHPEKGAAIMGGVQQLRDVIPGMKFHHEKWGGGGYPEGLREDKIPMQARIVAIADTFDAMTTNRPYQKAMELNYVVDKIVGFGGSRFDPKVIEAFVKAVKAGDIQTDEQVRGAA